MKQETKVELSRAKNFLFLMFCCAFVFISCKEEKNVQYLGQEPPGANPVKFAPGLITKDNQVEFGSVFNKDATEFYFGVDINGRAEIRWCKLVDGQWTKPETLISHETYSFNDPFLSKTEDVLYFISDRTLNNEGPKKDYDIWTMTREADGWSEMERAKGAINTASDEYYISIADNDKLYFASNVAADSNRKHDFDIYSSSLVDAEYDKAFRLGGAVNSKAYEADVFIAPDESYIIFSTVRREGYGKGDLYISFKNPDGSSTEAINMGLKINTEGHELCPFVTKDGEYFFYSSDEDIYWVDASLLELYR